MPDVLDEPSAMQTERRAPPRERALAALAARQHGPISIEQLRGLGLSASGIRDRVANGRLTRLHRGVYAYGHAEIKAEGHWMAAVLACGEGAVLSHRSAAALWEVRPSASARVDVTVPGPARRSRQGIEVHGSSTLSSADLTHLRDIPTTNLSRTLLDLAEVIDARALTRAFDRAEVLEVLDIGALAEVIRRNPGRRGLAPLRALLSNIDPARRFTRSELERRFLALCHRAGLPPPAVNAHLHLEGTYVEVDFHWPCRRLVAETDGYATHSTRLAFQRDRRRNQLLIRAGYRIVHFTWSDVVTDPDWVVETVGRALAGP